jgi:hypothetical protein
MSSWQRRNDDIETVSEMSNFYKASKNQSALLCEAPMVFKLLGCIVEQKNKYKDIACSVKNSLI